MAKNATANAKSETPNEFVANWGGWDEPGTHTTMGPNPETGNYFVNVRCPDDQCTYEPEIANPEFDETKGEGKNNPKTVKIQVDNPAFDPSKPEGEANPKTVNLKLPTSNIVDPVAETDAPNPAYNPGRMDGPDNPKTILVGTAAFTCTGCGKSYTATIANWHTDVIP